MKPKNNNTWNLPMLSLGAFLFVMLAFLAVPAQAQEATPLPDSACLGCHENLYYLYDTGKWFCQCETQMTCTCCHGGNPEALAEEEAHLGIVLYPTRNDSVACQQCHPDDYKARAERFSEIAGVSEIHSMPPTPIYSQPVNAEASPLASGIQGWMMELLHLTGLFFFSLVLIAFVILAYRCWKADCLASLDK